MKFLKKSILILVLPLYAFTIVHKYYLSVTNIAYIEKDDALQTGQALAESMMRDGLIHSAYMSLQKRNLVVTSDTDMQFTDIPIPLSNNNSNPVRQINA